MHELSSLIILIYTIWHHVPRRRTQIHKATVLSQKSHLTLESRSQLRRTIQRSAKPKLVAEHNLQLYNQSLCYVACSLFLLQMLFSNKHLVRLANMRTGNLVRKVLLFKWSSISSKDMSRHPGALFLRWLESAPIDGSSSSRSNKMDQISRNTLLKFPTVDHIN
jgi:hypothetical protein